MHGDCHSCARQVKELESQLGKLDAQYDACNAVMANGEVTGFPKELLGCKVCA